MTTPTWVIALVALNCLVSAMTLLVVIHRAVDRAAPDPVKLASREDLRLSGSADGSRVSAGEQEGLAPATQDDWDRYAEVMLRDARKPKRVHYVVRRLDPDGHTEHEEYSGTDSDASYAAWMRMERNPKAYPGQHQWLENGRMRADRAHHEIPQ